MIPSSGNKRIGILSQEEIQDLYGMPSFTDEEQEWFFELNDNEQSILKMRSTLESKINIILQLGYYKAKHQFFNFSFNDVPNDVDYIISRYFEKRFIRKKHLSREILRQNKKRVLKFVGYQEFSMKKHSAMLIAKAIDACRVSVDPVFIFRELLDYILAKNISPPGYTTMQDIVSHAILSDQNRIFKIITKEIKPDEKSKILDLLNQEEGLYAVTALKKLPKNFKPTAVYKEINYYNKYKEMYQTAKRILPVLEISKNSITYNAELVDLSTVQSLDRMANKTQVCFLLLCFVFQRCQRMLDNLAIMFSFIMNQYIEDVNEKARELLLDDSLDRAPQDAIVAKLLRFYIDKTIDPLTSFQSIKEKAYEIVPPEQIDKISAHLETDSKTYKEKFTWNAVDKISGKHSRVLRALFNVLPFESKQHKALLKAIDFLKTNLSEKKSLSTIPVKDFPKQFISRKAAQFIYDKGIDIINDKRYEYHCYQHIKKYIDSGSLFLSDSTKYQPLSSELLKQWEQTKKPVIRKLNKPLLNECFEKFIDEEAKPLDEKIIQIHEKVSNGENPDIAIKTEKDGTVNWSLPYPNDKNELNNPFYGKIPQLSIIQVLRYVNQETQFIKQFTHVKPHYSKVKQDEKALFACLIANGTNLGILKMSDISDLHAINLSSINKSYIRLSSLKAANDAISNCISSLPIFKYWNVQPEILHASLDGQKFKTQRETLLSRYSKKYWGFDKGIVAYTMVANHIPVNARIIGANEHESHYLFDLIYNNSSEVQPDIFSTDTEGTNQLNYLLLHTIERTFAPRYRSLKDKATSILSYSDPKKFSDCIIKPHSKVKEQLILKEEDNIKHILASLLIGETQQSNIIKKLSSMNFKSRTKRALWEMNAVLMSNYILHYIDDVVLRQSVQGSLNRGEAYHQLRRHIALINGRNFRGSTEMEVSIWNECARLLANAIIFYNAKLLNNLMDYFGGIGDTEKRDFIKRLSPVAWTHINLHGQYEFFTVDNYIDLDSILLSTKAQVQNTKQEFNEFSLLYQN